MITRVALTRLQNYTGSKKVTRLLTAPYTITYMTCMRELVNTRSVRVILVRRNVDKRDSLSLFIAKQLTWNNPCTQFLLSLPIVDDYTNAIEHLIRFEDEYRDIIRAIVGRGIVEFHKRKKHSLIHFIASNNCYQTFALLLSYGVDINLPDVYGNTPLHYAVMYYDTEDQSEIIEELVSADANMEALNNKGLTPLQEAIECENFTSALYLLSCGARHDTNIEEDPRFIEFQRRERDDY